MPAPARTARRRGAARIAQALEELPGVGRKTANVVLNSAFGQPTMPVDTHIFRVANRLGLAHGDTPRADRGRPAARSFPPSTCSTRITGCCCTAATSARHASPSVRAARWSTCARTRTRPCPLPRDAAVRRTQVAADAVLPRPGPLRRCGACTSRPGASIASRCRSSRSRTRSSGVIAAASGVRAAARVGTATRSNATTRPRTGQTNPFLHMGLHLAIREQVCDRSPGRHRGRAPLTGRRLGDVHEAEHAMIECLGEALWQAQRSRVAAGRGRLPGVAAPAALSAGAAAALPAHPARPAALRAPHCAARSSRAGVRPLPDRSADTSAYCAARASRVSIGGNPR